MYFHVFYVNQGKMENLHDEVAEFLSKKLSISFDAAKELISLLYVDKMRDDEYTEEAVPWLKEIEAAGFGEFVE